MITARADPGLEARAAAAGVVCLLRKPFKSTALIDCLDKGSANKLNLNLTGEGGVIDTSASATADLPSIFVISIRPLKASDLPVTIESHRGRLSLASTENKGALFRFAQSIKSADGDAVAPL